MIDEWANQTTAHPLGIGVLVLCIISTFMLPRKYCVLPFLFMIIAIPSVQRIVLVTIDFSFLRILILAFSLRILLNREQNGLTLRAPDIALFTWALWSILAYGILIGSISGSITRLGFMLDTIGSYYIGRIYLQNTEDIKRIVKFLGYLSVPMFAIFMIERTTGRNFFAEFGGIPKYTLIRDGRLRCQGPFSHPIMAGVFWATLFPWIGAIWASKTVPKILLVMFGVFILGIVFNTASSTPVIAVAFGGLGMVFFYFRRYMSYFRWGLLATLLSLHLVMKKPIWHLISRIDVAGGSTGWHRYNLIDKFFENVSEWWLVGIQSTRHWGWGLQDVTNQFVLEGVRGGLLGLVLFLVFNYYIFKIIGQGLKVSVSKQEKWMLWASGTMLFVHLMNYQAISYFGQMQNFLFLTLGGTVTLASTAMRSSRRVRINAEPLKS